MTDHLGRAVAGNKDYLGRAAVDPDSDELTENSVDFLGRALVY